jgi:hypothetical protein
MRSTLECKVVEGKRNVKKLQYEEFYNSCSLRKGQLADTMAIGEMRSTYTVLVRRSDGKKPLMTKIQIP